MDFQAVNIELRRTYVRAREYTHTRACDRARTAHYADIEIKSNGFEVHSTHVLHGDYGIVWQRKNMQHTTIAIEWPVEIALYSKSL